ncbi:AMP dependent coa ligase, partial [Operophtera brumata]
MSSTMRHTLRLLRAGNHRQAALRLNSTDSKILTSVYKDITHNHNTVNDFVWQNLDSDDKVAIILPNVPEYPVSILGVLQAGCNIKEALNALQTSIPIILIDNDELPEGTIKFAELAEDFNIDTSCLKSVERTAKDLAILPFSSATHQAVLPAILPFFHIFGFNSLLMNQMMLGCKLVTMPYFKPELFSLVFPVVFLGKHPAVKPEHLESKNILFRQGYGLTETNGAISVGDNTDTNHSSVGFVLPSSEVKIVDDEAATKEVMTEDGWFKTGDIGKYDDN